MRFEAAPNRESYREVPKVQANAVELPGYKLPLDYAPSESNVYGVLNRSLFPSALDDRDIKQGYAEYVSQAQVEISH